MKNILSALSESPATDSVRSKYYKCNFFNPEIPEGFNTSNVNIVNKIYNIYLRYFNALFL